MKLKKKIEEYQIFKDARSYSLHYINPDGCVVSLGSYCDWYNAIDCMDDASSLHVTAKLIFSQSVHGDETQPEGDADQDTALDSGEGWLLMTFCQQVLWAIVFCELKHISLGTSLPLQYFVPLK